MSAGHTPGPWRVEDDPKWPRLFRVLHGPAMELSWCRNAIDISAENAARREADAALMAAAPDLLALAYQYRNDLKYPPAPDSVDRRLSAIAAAIAKATGQ